jgi:hypothetical protein
MEGDYEETQFQGHKVGSCKGRAMVMGGGNCGRGAELRLE